MQIENFENVKIKFIGILVSKDPCFIADNVRSLFYGRCKNAQHPVILQA